MSIGTARDGVSDDFQPLVGSFEKLTFLYSSEDFNGNSIFVRGQSPHTGSRARVAVAVVLCGIRHAVSDKS